MKKLVSFLTILTFVVSLSLFPLGAQAQVEIFNIKLDSLKDGEAILSWNTNENSKTYVYFGQSANALDSYIGNTVSSKVHEARLTGLDTDSAYYYKIVAISETGHSTESFVRYFDTEDMEDTKSPKISNFKILQTTNKGVGMSFTTNEKARVDIKYGFDLNNLEKSWGDRGHNKEHNIIIRDLAPNAFYYMRIMVIDKSGNYSFHYTDFQTKGYNDYNEITVSQVTPESLSQAKLMPENAVITWRSNVLAKSEIFYSTDATRLREKKDVSREHTLEHKAVLTDLKPDTTYYFKIKLNSDLNRDSLETDVYSFRTSGLSWNYLDLYYRDGDIVSEGRRHTNYLIYEHGKIPFENNSFKNRGYNDDVVNEVNVEHINEYPTMPGYYGVFYTGQVVKEENKSTVYVIDGKYKRPVANWMVFQYLNYDANDIIVADGRDLRSYEETEAIYHSREITGNTPIANQTLVKSPEGKTVYLITNGYKLPFLNQQAFYNHGHNWHEVKTMPWHILSSIPTGQVIIE